MPPPPPEDLDRRAFLALLAGGLAACGPLREPRDVAASPASTPPAPSPSPTRATATPTPPPTTPPPSPSPSPTPTLPPVPARWEPSDDEVGVGMKSLAAGIVHALGNHDLGATPGDVAAAVVGDGARRDEFAATIAPLVRPDRWSRTEVLYPQLGGYSDPVVDNRRRRTPLPTPPGGWPYRMGSVMVRARVTTGEGPEPTDAATRVLDLRFWQDTAEDGWRLVRLASIGGSPVPRPDVVAPAAAAVLDDPRIELADSARWDIHRGVVTVGLLEVLARLARRTPFTVHVLESGHPHNVFNTDRVSHHTIGRAVDITTFDGVDVVDDRGTDGATYAITELLYDTPGVANLGSPWALDARGGRSFTDFVHQDHLHVAVPAGPAAIGTADGGTGA